MAQRRSDRHLAYGMALREIRSERLLSQEALAHRAGLDRTYLSGIERGERNPSLESLLKIMDALELPLSELATRAEQVDASSAPVKR